MFFKSNYLGLTQPSGTYSISSSIVPSIIGTPKFSIISQNSFSMIAFSNSGFAKTLIKHAISKLVNSLSLRSFVAHSKKASGTINSIIYFKSGIISGIEYLPNDSLTVTPCLINSSAILIKHASAISSISSSSTDLRPDSLDLTQRISCS